MTPQNQLYNLAEQIQRLSDMFERDEDGNNIFDVMKEIKEQQQEIINCQSVQENLMNLIIKLLSKHNYVTT